MMTMGQLLLPPDAGDLRIILGVSGGVDSMSMADLFMRFKPCRGFAVACVNFSLRGKESDGDAELVRKWCGKMGIRLFEKRFDTESYAAGRKISIEMAARELRYRWFDELLDTEGYDYVAVAHNRNDNCETLILNLLRGTGIRGVSGMGPVSGRILRPMLSVTRSEIYEYASKNGVPFREDSTNADVRFARNRIRNNVFREFVEINPSFLSTLSNDMRHFDEANGVLEQYFMLREGTLYRRDGDMLYVSIPLLSREKNAGWWLYRILEGCGFDESQLDSILASIDSQPGITFNSPTHTLLRDREYFKVMPKKSAEDLSGDPDSSVSIEFRGMTRNELAMIRKPDLFVDASKLALPLNVRRWREGDRFRPFGMHGGTRKVSDFLIGKKLDRFEKERVMVVSDYGGPDKVERIIAVAGLEIDDRFRIDSFSEEGDEGTAVSTAVIHFNGFRK
ncbi:MAG: tRNA lysidine(34) synthetase TilS [Bacteroidales bacterium]|jgi:tRNA(Ile)-lysidine synthase|nr:tRNA lysidine(34) synthetase TilS [Bacteroidales bacterium]MCI2121344.1 tRNA lysidine(34) synthetase TilS [Bacteroidales bacterium]MCI2145255.1 tRNA lysidine(34) synthetase TilS [Bacteroidales bacterium]